MRICSFKQIILTALTEGHFNLRDFGGGCPEKVRTANQVFVVKNYPIAFGLDDEAGAQKFSSRSLFLELVLPARHFIVRNLDKPGD